MWEQSVSLLFAPGKWGQIKCFTVVFSYEAPSSLPSSRLSSSVSAIYVFLLFLGEKYRKEELSLGKEAHLSLVRSCIGRRMAQRELSEPFPCVSLLASGFFPFVCCSSREIRWFVCSVLMLIPEESSKIDFFHFPVTLRPFVVGCGQQKVAS